MLKPLALLLGFCALALASPARAEGPQPPVAAAGQRTLADLVKQYSLPESRFVDVDGARVHYVEEGQGPVVLLLHGSYYSLREWGDWSKALSRDFRVIRMDRLRFGLTQGFPDGEVGYAREQALVEGFVKALGLKQFGLAGASSGGIVAAQYADRHPDQVRRLVLLNFPLGHARITGSEELRAMSRENSARGWQSPRFAELQLQDALVDHRHITPELVQRMTDFANREDPEGKARGAFAAAAQFGEAERAQMLGRLKMPVLVIWSENNRTLPVEDGRAAFAAIGSSQKRFSIARNIGHAAPLEGGPATARAARTFFLGGWPAARFAGQ
ncbi:alpha/beta fold hydrolase [Polymorphobacter sp.]|uniref:alpha/beta fold hydrolase n=1 Tax=Polymorphobacter sp. TaxID=1909290 RepID=UPI003F728369